MCDSCAARNWIRDTVASDTIGMIRHEEAYQVRRVLNGSDVSAKGGHKGCTIWLTGLSGAGKTTISRLLELRLRELGAKVELLDGDVVRTHLCKGLGFSKEDRDENVRRIGFVCELLSRNGVIAIAAAISPYRALREELRSRIPNFVEVYVECPLELLIQRDAKGLYKRALAGEISQFTGISDPYERPLAPEVIVDSSQEAPDACVNKIWSRLANLGLILFD
jgi:adenylyl-sulfate kinase